MNADSVKSKLRKSAQSNSRLFQDELVIYCLERTIYRISISRFKDNFTLKGGIFLYAVFEGNFSRATKDIDLLGGAIDNTIENLNVVFQEIFMIKSDDAISYDFDSMSLKIITEFKDYHGVNLNITALLDKTKVPVSIDIGFGDVIYPQRTIMDFPTLIGMKSPKIYAYSISSVIAEKFEAIVSLGYANSRFKDFYDIYVLISKFNFVGSEIQNAIKETFLYRNTALNNIVAFENEFYEDRERILRWNAFIRKKRALENIEFKFVLDLIKQFLVPIVYSINNNELYMYIWGSKNLSWEKIE